MGGELAAAAQVDVAVCAPRCTPRVLDLPVVLASLGAVSDGEHAVVELVTACGGHYTGGVELERALVGLNGDRHGLLGHGGHEGGLAALGHVLEARDGGLHGARAGVRSALAGAVGGGVGVVGLAGDALVRDDELEGIIHEAAVAALVAEAARAINELLLGQAGERAGLDE